MRLIDVEPLMKFIQDKINKGENGFESIEIMGEIEFAPTIDAVPVKHGHWESTSGYDRCSVCRGLELGQTKYCPHCGAKMDKGVSK